MQPFLIVLRKSVPLWSGYLKNSLKLFLNFLPHLPVHGSGHVLSSAITPAINSDITKIFRPNIFLKFRIFSEFWFFPNNYIWSTIFLELNFCKYLKSVISGVEWHINEWNKNQILKPLIIYSINFRISWITEGIITWFGDNIFMAPPTGSSSRNQNMENERF